MLRYRKHGDSCILECVGPSFLLFPRKIGEEGDCPGRAACILLRDSSVSLGKLSSCGHAVVNFCDIVHFPWTLTIQRLAKIKGLNIGGLEILSVFLSEEDV